MHGQRASTISTCRRTLGGVSALLSLGLPALAQGWGWQGNWQFVTNYDYADDIDLKVSRMEITQGIQVFDPSADVPSNNSLPLAANRSTWLRVYVDPGPTSLAVPYVTGKVDVYRGGVLTNTWGPDFPGWITVFRNPNRSLESSTLNFALPNDLEGGNIDVVVTLDHVGVVPELDESNNTARLDDLVFQCTRTPEILYTPIRYVAADESDTSTLGLPDPARIGPGVGAAFVWGIYPFADSRARYHPGAFPPVVCPRNVDSFFDEILFRLELTRWMTSPSPDIAYGWFRGNPYSGNGRANNIPGTVAFGNTDPARDQRTFAHELGHVLGRIHGTDRLQPEVGVDVQYALGLPRMKLPSMFDIMVAAQLTNAAWIAPVTYQAVLETNALDCQGHDGIFGFHFNFGGQTDSNGAGQLFAVWRAQSKVAETPLRNSDGDPDERVLFVLDKDDHLLYSNSAVAAFEDDVEGRDDRAALSWVVPDLADAHAIELRGPGGVNLLDRREASDNPPMIDILSPAPGSNLDGTIEVKWVGDDADGDGLRYSLRYSPDDGATFVPLEVEIDADSAVVDTSVLAASAGTGVIELIATDGFHCSSVRVDELSLQNVNAPRLELIAPREGALYVAGSPVRLQAVAYDAEDGALGGQSLSWSSSLDGALGSGETRMLSALKVGLHTLTVTATDTDGHSSQREVRFIVRPSFF